MNKTTYPFLKKSPIIEGNLFLQFDGLISIEALKSIIESYRSDDIKISELKNFNINAGNLQKAEKVTSSIDIVGYRIDNRTANYVGLLRKSDILVSMKEPYQGWDILEEKFNNILTGTTKSYKINSKTIGCRFINSFDILTQDKLNLNDYFNVGLSFKNSFISEIDGYTFKFNYKKGIFNSTVNFALNKSEKGLSIIFDIEVTRAIKSEDVKNKNLGLAELRDFKNYIFFKSLTEKTINTFK